MSDADHADRILIEQRNLSRPLFQRSRDATLAELPDGDRIVAFDAHRARLLAPQDAIRIATPARQEEICRIVVERVVVRDRQLDSIVWTPPVRPFFERQQEYPQGDSNP